MRRLVPIVLVVACGGGSKPPVTVTNQVAPRPTQQPLHLKDAPSQYDLERGDVIAEILLVPPSDWTDTSDWKHTIEYRSAAGSTIHIELADDGTASCKHDVVEADAAYADAVDELCASVVPDRIRDDLLSWRLEVTPSTVKLADIESVNIGFTVTNPTDAVIDAHHDPLTVAIDGKSSSYIDMAFGNGGYSSDWDALPPGKSEHDSREGIEWVTSAGDHEITLLRLDHEIARATLHVKP